MPSRFRIILILGLLLCAPHGILRACDACGASVNTVSTGILPNFYRHYVGLAIAQTRYVDKHHDVNTPMEDRFLSFELKARLHVTKRWQCFASLPLNQVQHREGAASYTYMAVGDAMLWGLYSLWQQQASNTGQTQHMLQLGGGVKMPSGKYNYLAPDYSWTPGAQSGTGSWDALFLAQYILRHKNKGIQTSISGRVNTANPFQYQFGHRGQWASSAFVQFTYKQCTFIPFVGVQWEMAACDKRNQMVLTDTRMQCVFGQCGGDVYIKNMSVGLRGQAPLKQWNMGPQSLPRWNVNLLYHF